MSTSATTVFSDVLNEFYQSGFNYILDNSQTPRAKRWVNQAYQELCGLEKWPFLRTSTTGTSPVTLTDYSRILFVRDTTTNFKLVEIDEDTLTDLQPNLTTTGTAGWYYVSYASGSPTVNAFPVTTNTLQVVYYKNPAPLVSDSDVLVVPDQWIDIVVLGAARRGYLDGVDAQPDYYAATKQEWVDRIGTMRTQLLPRPSYQQVSVWPSSSTDW